jgi:hypothetical protein
MLYNLCNKASLNKLRDSWIAYGLYNRRIWVRFPDETFLFLIAARQGHPARAPGAVTPSVKLCILPTQCIYMFQMILTVNSDYFPKQQ